MKTTTADQLQEILGKVRDHHQCEQIDDCPCLRETNPELTDEEFKHFEGMLACCEKFNPSDDELIRGYLRYL